MRRILCSVAAACGMAGSAGAQDVWEFNVTPYLWMAGIDGDLAPLSGLPTQSVSLSFGDILEDLDYGVFLFASARKDDWVLYFDAASVQTDSDEGVGGPNVDSVDIKSRTTNATVAAGRTVAETDRYRLDAYAGARFWKLKNEFTVNTTEAAGGAEVRIDSDADWVDPLIGFAGSYEVNDRWTVFGSAELGGFGIGSDLEWSALGGATYFLSEGFGITGAWRVLSVDYREDGIVYDVSQTGPLLGVTFRF